MKLQDKVLELEEMAEDIEPKSTLPVNSCTKRHRDRGEASERRKEGAFEPRMDMA